MPPSKSKAEIEKIARRQPRPGVLNPSMDDSARGMIVKRFTALEALIDAIVCSYYFGAHKPPREFLEDVLYDESFSFAMRRSVFEKILKREGAYSEPFMQDVRRMSKLRNEAAHVRRGHSFDGEERAWEFFDLANKVEKHFARVVFLKLALRFHADPLPTRAQLLKAAKARS
jgi:hypothetical protein